MLARRAGVGNLQWLLSIVNTGSMRVEPQKFNISIILFFFKKQITKFKLITIHNNLLH